MAQVHHLGGVLTSFEQVTIILYIHEISDLPAANLSWNALVSAQDCISYFYQANLYPVLSTK